MFILNAHGIFHYNISIDVIIPFSVLEKVVFLKFVAPTAKAFSLQVVMDDLVTFIV